MINLIKSAEVYGSEAIVYNGSNAPPDLYIDLIVNNKLVPGMGAGDLYGRGVYTTYNLSGTATGRGNYGNFIYKLKVNLYGFISFNPDITKKIYGEALTPSQQYEKIYGRRDYIFKGLMDLESGERFSPFSSDLADPASLFLRGRVKGLIFTGRNDGDVAVIYDPLTIVPIAWKKTEDSSWSSFDKDQIKPAIGRGAAGSFKKSKYDEVDVSKDRGAKESISVLSNFHGDQLGNKEIASVNYLMDNAPTTFLSRYSEKDWAKDYLKTAIDRSLFMISPEEFLKYFNDKPWFEDNSGPVAKNYAEREPHTFLSHFIDKPWAKPYIGIAAKSYAEKDPLDFLISFADKPWAKLYIDSAAKSYAEKKPYNFLYNFINKPWAKEYIPTAAKSCAEKYPYYFLKDFLHKSWAEHYIDLAAKSLAKEDPYAFLSDFINEPWAQKHIPAAAESIAENGTYAFLAKYIDEPWAQSYIPTAAKNLAESDSYRFLNIFSDEDWAQPYIYIAAKNYANKEPDSFLLFFIGKPWANEAREDLGGKSLVQYAEEVIQKKSSYSPKLIKLAKVLRSLGLSKEASEVSQLPIEIKQ